MRPPLDSHMIILQGLPLLLVHFLTRFTVMAQTYEDDYENRPEKVPYFLPGPTNVSVHKGDTAVLTCRIQNLGTKMVIWRRASDPNPLTIGKSVFVGDGRYTAEENKGKKEWRLLIDNVGAADAGVYECQISSKIKSIHHILLRVNVTARPQRKNYVNFKKEPPTVAVHQDPGQTEITITGPKFVEKGDSILLTCNAVGSLGPPRNLDWFMDGIKLTPDSVRQIKISKETNLVNRTLVSQLVIKHSRMDDAGTYVCRSDLSITSAKVHVLNAGSTNVRRGTSATGTGQNGEDPNGHYRDIDEGADWFDGESSSSSSSSDSNVNYNSNRNRNPHGGKVIQKQTGNTNTNDKKGPNNVSIRSSSYSHVLLCAMLTLVILLSTTQRRTILLCCR